MSFSKFVADGDRSISKVVFLCTRKYSKDAASLVAGGPYGDIHMWNVFHGGKLLAKFRGVSENINTSEKDMYYHRFFHLILSVSHVEKSPFK